MAMLTSNIGLVPIIIASAINKHWYIASANIDIRHQQTLVTINIASTNIGINKHWLASTNIGINKQWHQFSGINIGINSLELTLASILWN